MTQATTGVTLLALLGAVIGLQAAREQRSAVVPTSDIAANVLYVRSPEVMKRAALSFDALAADVYWIRAVQYYGRSKLSTERGKNYDLLYPLLDLTTSLDPQFNIAYRFGAIFLAEAYPAGPGRPDQAIALLQKGLAAQPQKWEFVQDIGFIYYWWLQDYASAAEWFQRGSVMPGAPNWLGALGAVTLAQGGSRASSRRLWQAILDDSEGAAWLRAQAEFRIVQLDAMDQMAQLEDLVRRYAAQAGRAPRSWLDIVRAGYLRGVPLDPRQFPYRLDPDRGTVSLSPESTLNPLPAPERTRG